MVVKDVMLGTSPFVDRSRQPSRDWIRVTCSYWTLASRSTSGTAVEPTPSRRTRYRMIYTSYILAFHVSTQVRF